MKLRIGKYPADEEIDAIERVVAASGPMTWMADGNGAYDWADSVKLGAALDGLGFRWLEEPLPTDDYLAYAPLARELSIPLAGGEILKSADATEPYLRAGSFDLVQPDVSICGGIGGVLEIAARRAMPAGSPSRMLQRRDRARSHPPHPGRDAGPTRCPEWAEPILEHDVGENPIRTAILAEPLTLDDGWMTIPDGPGLGVMSTRWHSGGWWRDLRAKSRSRRPRSIPISPTADSYASRPGGGEVVEGADVTLCSTGLPFRSINGAVEIDLAPATADHRIAEVGAWFGERGLPWRWLVGPTSRPEDLGERLVRAGFELVSAARGWC